MSETTITPGIAHPILVIGIGNEFRRDDGAGLAVAHQIAAAEQPNLVVKTAQAPDVTWLDDWPAYEAVFLVDAVSGQLPGVIHRWDAVAAGRTAARFRSSTHDMGLPELVELARTLERLPRRLIVYGIEGANFEIGCGMSPPVADAIARVVRHILDEARQTGLSHSRHTVKVALPSPTTG